MARWSSLWVCLQEMVQDMQQGQYTFLVAADLDLPNIVNNHVPNFFAAIRVSQRY